MNRRTDTSGALDDVRREIDAIDDALLDLLKQRYRAVAKVKAIKGLDKGIAAPALRPAREAQVIRRLVSAAGEEVPGAFVARFWFELMAAASRVQSPVTLHLPRSHRLMGHRDLVRFHAGAELPIIEYDDPKQAVQAVVDAPGDVTICPLENGDEQLAGIEAASIQALLHQDAGVRIIGRLPFISSASRLEAWVLGKSPFEPSGDDVSVVAFRSENAQAHVDCGLESLAPPRTYADGAWHVIEVSGFVAAEDQRLDALRSAADVEEVRHLGGYPCAIDLGEAS